MTSVVDQKPKTVGPMIFLGNFGTKRKLRLYWIQICKKISAVSTGSTFYCIIKILGTRNSEDLLPILVPNESLFSAVYDSFLKLNMFFDFWKICKQNFNN